MREWRLFRELRTVALERFCKSILMELAEVATAQHSSYHQAYLKAYRLMRERDDEIASAFNDPRRSRADRQLVAIHGLGLITPEEFQSFDPDTREFVESMVQIARDREARYAERD